MTEVQYPSPAPTPSPPPDSMHPTSIYPPGASTSHISRDLPPGYHSPWRRPLYSWQYTPSLLTSSPTTTTNCFPSSERQFSTRKWFRSVRPGTLTRTELLEYPNKGLRWLFPSTPTTYRHSSHPSSSSLNGSRSRDRQRQPLHPMQQLLPFRPRLPRLQTDPPLVPLLCASPYSFGTQMPKPHLPKGWQLPTHLRLLPHISPPLPELWLRPRCLLERMPG